MAVDAHAFFLDRAKGDLTTVNVVQGLKDGLGAIHRAESTRALQVELGSDEITFDGKTDRRGDSLDSHHRPQAIGCSS